MLVIGKGEEEIAGLFGVDKVQRAVIVAVPTPPPPQEAMHRGVAGGYHHGQEKYEPLPR